MGEVFTNPTVKNVIFQINFTNLFFIESRIPDFQRRIMAEFPESNLQINRQFPVFFDTKEEKPKDAELTTKVWIFKNDDGYEVSVALNSMSIVSTTHKAYDNPTAEHRFRDTIESVVGTFFSIVDIPLVNRIGLRYIDHCPLFDRTNNSLEEYYNLVYPSARFALEDTPNFSIAIETKKDENMLIYQEASGVNESGAPILMLDFDAYRSGKIKTEDIMSITDALHSVISTEYENATKEPLREYMRKG